MSRAINLQPETEMGRRKQYLALCCFTTFSLVVIIYISRCDIDTKGVVADNLEGRNMTTNVGKQSRNLARPDSIPSSIVEGDRKLISRFQQRKALLKEQCALIRSPNRARDMALEPPEHLIVNEEHRIIYCNVPKVACTNWKAVFLKLGGFNNLNTSLEDHSRAITDAGQLYLKYLHDYSDISQRRFMLQNYTKFFFVRHPFTRILSAFQNKLAPNISSYFHFGGRHEKWLSIYGKQIINRYRGKSEANRASSNWETEYDLTFAEFIRFLVDPDTDSKNAHWNNILELCQPCDIDYDIIGHFETITEDANFILRLVKVGSDITFYQPDQIHRTNSSNQNNTEKFYSQISTILMYKLAMLYATDFNLFGYDPYPYLRL